MQAYPEIIILFAEKPHPLFVVKGTVKKVFQGVLTLLPPPPPHMISACNVCLSYIMTVALMKEHNTLTNTVI